MHPLVLAGAAAGAALAFITNSTKGEKNHAQQRELDDSSSDPRSSKNSEQQHGHPQPNQLDTERAAHEPAPEEREKAKPAAPDQEPEAEPKPGADPAPEPGANPKPEPAADQHQQPDSRATNQLNEGEPNHEPEL